MTIRQIIGMLGLIVSIAACEQAFAEDACCGEVVATPCYVERTVMRPQYVTETRMCTSTEYRYETRERTITVQNALLKQLRGHVK